MIVFGLQAKATGVWVPNEVIASYVAEHPDKLIGWASVDPNEPDCVERLEHAVGTLGLRGLKLGPAYQHFDPTDRRHWPLFTTAQRLGIPIIWHQGTTFPSQARLRVSSPLALEDVAMEFPELRMIVAHLGHPWEEDLVALIRKAPNVYADISAVPLPAVALLAGDGNGVRVRGHPQAAAGLGLPVRDRGQRHRRPARDVNDIVEGAGLSTVSRRPSTRRSSTRTAKRLPGVGAEPREWHDHVMTIRRPSRPTKISPTMKHSTSSRPPAVLQPPLRLHRPSHQQTGPMKHLGDAGAGTAPPSHDDLAPAPPRPSWGHEWREDSASLQRGLRLIPSSR